MEGVPNGIVANVMDYDIIVNSNSSCFFMFTFRLIHFRKVLDFLILPSYWLNSTSIVFFFQGWLWHWIIHKNWYAILTTKTNCGLPCYIKKKENTRMWTRILMSFNLNDSQKDIPCTGSHTNGRKTDANLEQELSI